MDLDQSLAALCKRVEVLAPGSVAGIVLCSDDSRVVDRGVFPSLPDSFATAIKDAPTSEPYFGSCAKSITTGQVVTCPDIAADREFDPEWRSLCLAHGVRALQSRPIMADGKPRGTFVLTFREPRQESDWDVILMAFGADAPARQLEAATAVALP